MTFKQDMDRIRKLVRSREKTLYNNSVEHAFKSIRFGSEVTGAPGQPVQSGNLLRSYKRKRKSRTRDEITSKSPYAHIIEDNKRGATLRSKVGGFHSIKMTRLGWGRIVVHEGKKMGLTATGSEFIAATQIARGPGGQFLGNAPTLGTHA